jgi:ribonuclease Z
LSIVLTILGSSSALPTSERYPSAHVLTVHERPFLIDCGEGTQMQLRRNRIRMGRINHIFISHLHGDHIFGMYGLLSSFNLMARKNKLALYAPAGYDQILLSHLADFDIHLGYELQFIPLSGNDPIKILDEKFISVTAFPLKHRVPTYGFLFREKPAEKKMIKEAIRNYNIPVSDIRFIKRGADFITATGEVIPNETITIPPPEPLSYAYCSDTEYFDRIATFVKGVDLLYHEATFDSSRKSLAKQTGHSTTDQAALTALKADVCTLIIGHFSSRYKDISLLEREARAIFPNTIVASEGLAIDVASCRKS